MLQRYELLLAGLWWALRVLVLALVPVQAQVLALVLVLALMLERVPQTPDPPVKPLAAPSVAGKTW